MTVQYHTTNSTPRQNNVIDLTQYRQRMGLPLWNTDIEPTPARPRIDRQRRAWMLDACASLSVVAVTIVFTVQILL